MYDFDPQALRAEYETLSRQRIFGISINKLAFSIMHGNGNIILVVDEALSSLSSSDIGSDFARALCEAFRTIRIDGISFIRTTTKPVRMIYFDRDGTCSSMCGNGLRCVTQYGIEQGHLRVDSDTVMTDDGPKWVSAAGGNVRVSVGWGRELQQIAVDRYFVFSGVPHLVVLLGDSDDLNAIDVKAEGASLRYDHQLSRRLNHPEGLNVNFMQRHGDGSRSAPMRWEWKTRPWPAVPGLRVVLTSPAGSGGCHIRFASWSSWARYASRRPRMDSSYRASRATCSREPRRPLARSFLVRQPHFTRTSVLSALPLTLIFPRPPEWSPGTAWPVNGYPPSSSPRHRRSGVTGSGVAVRG